MVQQIVPSMGATGIWNLKQPFEIDVTQYYTVGAIRYFKDIENDGVSVLDEYYLPAGLTEADYAEDLKHNPVMVTLMSDRLPAVYVPSTYILSYPQLNGVTYRHVIVSASLGPLPSSVNLDFMRQQVAAIISDTIGLEPIVNLGIAPTSNLIDPRDSETLETARQQRIVNRTTDHAKIVELTAKVDDLEEKNRILVDILKANGLLS